MLNKSIIQFHSCYIKKYNIRLSLLTLMICDYIFWLKLAIMRSVTDTFVSRYAEYNVFKLPVHLKI